MKLFPFFFALIFFPHFLLYAQEQDLIDIDFINIDSIFDEPSSEIPSQTPSQQTPPQSPAQTSVLGEVRRRGIEFNLSYFFRGAINPGWDVYPWELDGSEQFSWAIGVEMGSSMEIIARVSENFRVRSVISYQIPRFSFNLEDFFFDYNFFDTVFLRAGKFEQSWGVSPNFGFANLLSRIAVQQDNIDPEEPSARGPSYIVKFDIPIGVGGLQLLALTRVDIAGGAVPTRNYFGYGGKFNLAFPWADFNLGFFYQDFMATRAFLSTKTTLWNTDIYNELLFIYNNHTDNTFKFAFNIGLSRSFFDNKLEINAEYFYNGEESTEYYRPESEFRQEESIPFIEGHNFALNILYRFGGSINPRIFTRLLYGDDSVSLIVGLRINPFPNIEVYFAIPMVFGKENGHYYQDSFNILNQHRPFSFLLYITFRGSVRANHYY